MTDSWQERTELLLGQQKVNKLQDAHVLVAGLGGVGAYAAENLCRAGVGKLTIVDHDVVQPSNRNRQLIAFNSTEGKRKADLMAKRLEDINPRVELTVLSEFLGEGNIGELLSNKFDYVVDAIDTLSPKIFLIYNALKQNLPLVSSMGAGGKLDPSQVQISDISDSYQCRLAFMLRKKLRKFGVHEGFRVVFSSEPVNKEAVKLTEGEQNKKSTVGTISYMPAVFGCMCASVVIRELTGN